MFTHLISLVLALTIGSVAYASPASDALGQCLSNNTTGKDRKDLAKWIFMAMSAHPDIGTIAKPSAQDADAVQRTMGNLLTRLVADDCPAEMVAVLQTDGSVGTKIAFEYLGRVAMTELMSNPQVNSAISGFERYVDKAKMNRAFAPKN